TRRNGNDDAETDPPANVFHNYSPCGGSPRSEGARTQRALTRGILCTIFAALHARTGALSAAAQLTALSSPGGPPRQKRFDLADEAHEMKRLRVIIVAARRQRLLAIPVHDVRGQREDGNVLELRVIFKLARCDPAIDIRQAHVHQYQG